MSDQVILLFFLFFSFLIQLMHAGVLIVAFASLVKSLSCVQIPWHRPLLRLHTPKYPNVLFEPIFQPQHNHQPISMNG